MDSSKLPLYLKGKKYIGHDSDPAEAARKIAEAAKTHMERREELNKKALGDGTVDLMKSSIGYRGADMLRPVYERIGTAKLYSSPNFLLRFRVLEAELEAITVTCQHKARIAKAHMDKMQEQSGEDSNALPLFLATAAAIQQDANMTAAEQFLVQIRNYLSIAEKQPDVAAELWSDTIDILTTQIAKGEDS